MTGRASPGKCSPAAAAPAATLTHARLSTWWPPVFVSLDAMPGLRSRYFIDLTGFIKCLDKVPAAVVNSPMLARRLHHSPRRNSFPCILLPPLGSLFSPPSLYFQSLAASFCKTPGVGVPLREFARCTEVQKCFLVSPLFATLTHSASRKSFPCHSYANTRDMGVTAP